MITVSSCISAFCIFVILLWIAVYTHQGRYEKRIYDCQRCAPSKEHTDFQNLVLVFEYSIVANLFCRDYLCSLWSKGCDLNLHQLIVCTKQNQIVKCTEHLTIVLFQSLKKVITDCKGCSCRDVPDYLGLGLLERRPSFVLYACCRT